MCSQFAQVLRPLDPPVLRSEEETEALVSYIDSNVVGKEETFLGPFGRRKVVYCDYAASARNMHWVEEYILKEVLPLYGNIHTSTSVTSMQSSLFMEESREILSKAVNASEEDAVLFAGHGCTGAIRKLISSLSLPSTPPTVFFGPCEHHSHLLPWQEIGSTIVRISETKEGMLDLTDLETKLAFYQKTGQKPLIGCFSAASSTTGILTDDIATTILLHQYGALAIWDYGTAAPYVTLDMNPLVPGIDQKGAYKDAMFFSGHKFIGGVQSPGILIAKKSLFSNVTPQGCAGVPAFFLTHEDVYMKDTELYEEIGTAAVVESVRAGIAMKIKQTVGVSAIMEREAKIVKTACSFFRKIPEIILLGSTTQVDRLAIFSFMVRHTRGAYLHHNFVCAVLNDLFGIQTRGGCSCAGTYARDLMGINKDLASNFEAVLQGDCENCENVHSTKKEQNYEMLRPGFVRISLPYFMSEAEIAYVLEAIKMVATEGWKLLPQYVLNPETGEWRHNSNTVFRERKWLGNLKYIDGKLIIPERKFSSAGPCPSDFNDCLRIARSTFNKARKIARRHPVADHCPLLKDDDLNPIRWFMLPSEAQDLLLGHSRNVKQEVPFSPSAYKGSRPVPTSQDQEISPIGLKSNQSSYSDLNVLRQRSESSSPAREDKRSNMNKQLMLRERCYSLCSTLNPESHSNRLNPFTRQRLLSCSSAAENSDSDLSYTVDVDRLGRAATPPNLKNNDLVYIEGITKELATEIKSELREVIAQVQDVLSENTDPDHANYNYEKKPSIDYQNIYKRKAFSLPIPIDDQNKENSPKLMQNNHQMSDTTQKTCCNHNSLPDTISAERFSEFLVGFTSDVVSEMKSEFRDVVNAVDDLISPTPQCTEKTSSDKKSVEVSVNSPILSLKSIKNAEKIKECDSKDILRSQDSGINLTDRDSSPPEICDAKVASSQNKENETDSKSILSSSVPEQDCVWYLPPKNIWNPTCEAIKEFDMIQDGDRVLVCLRNGYESIALLHTLRQYQYYSNSKGKNFELAVSTESSSFSKQQISYLKCLNVRILSYDDRDLLGGSHKEPLSGFPLYAAKGRLYAVAKHHNFNVIALGHDLDDIAESFLMSVFHNGYLQTMKAKYLILKENLRVIRPFVYVREQAIRKFVDSVKLTSLLQPSAFVEKQKERKRIKQLLAEQEILFPKLFYSMKSALKPLLMGGYPLDKIKNKEDENL